MFDIEIPADYLQELLGYQFTEVAKELLDKASPALVESTKSAMRAVVQHGGESDMINSVKANKAKEAVNGAVIVNVNPKGYSNHTFSRESGGRVHRYPVSNALKAIWLEYGVAGRQPPRPWLSASKRAVESKVMELMQEEYNKKVNAE